MATKDELKAQKASVVSSIIAVSAKGDESGLDPKNPEDRAYVQELLGELLGEIKNRDTGELRWAIECKHMHYDVYLAKKEAGNGASAYDLTRPGLIKAQFSHEEAFQEHLARIEQTKEVCTEMKLCKVCGPEQGPKLANKFKKGGGSTCNACRMKQYRERKAKEQENG